MSGPFAIVLDGAAVPGGHAQIISLSTQTPVMATLHMNFADIVNVIGEPLRPEDDDWLDLLGAVYAADLLCVRGANEDYTREIQLSMRLRNPDAMRQAIPAVEELFERLCQDRLTISVEAWATAPTARFPSRRREPPSLDAVSLLSGGLDSASAATQLLADGATPCFVSSRTAGHVISSQRRVLAALGARFGGIPLNVGFTVSVRNRPDHPVPAARERSQRARTMLFIGVAALVAARRDVPTVTIGENGVMAINAPLTGGRFGSFSTHTAHPHVLGLISELASDRLNAPLRVVNPSAFETKTEVVRRLSALGMAHSVPETHSCWIARQDSHCGKCVPCLVRRFAVEVAGVPDASYDVDIFARRWDPGDPTNRDLADYIAFVRSVRDSNDVELLVRFAELAVPGGPSARAEATAMYRRWTVDVLGFLSRQPQIAGLIA